MSHIASTTTPRAIWLRNYYFARAAFSFAWVAAALTAARQSDALAAGLLLVYPAWDALANMLDARMTGGTRANPTQRLNIWISALVTLAVAAALASRQEVMLVIFGAWAIAAGVLQLATAIRRRKDDRGQWVMMLSGAQSALAGGFFLSRQGSGMPALQTLVGYAAIGAAYFLLSALIVLLRHRRQGSRGGSAAA